MATSIRGVCPRGWVCVGGAPLGGVLREWVCVHGVCPLDPETDVLILWTE